MARIEQSIQQKQRLTPKQILEANILQLNMFLLEKKILDELENNPALEIDENNDQDIQDDDSSTNEDDDFEWDELIYNPEEYDYSPSNYKDEIINNYKDNIPSKNLADDMIEQLEDIDINEDSIKIAYEILGNLDERGFLNIEPVIIADRLNYSEDKILDLIKMIQSLDPPGIASRNLEECLLAQLKKKYPDENIAFDVINNYFNDFINKRFDKIIKKSGCSSDEMSKVIELVSILNPNPAVNYSASNAEHIIPDFIIEKYDGEWHVSINNSFVPELRINKNYLKMLDKYSDNKEVKNFVKKKIERANWFISAIEQRNNTYKKVMLSIIKHQKNYFNSDDKKLKPLILKNIAEDIKMDISTVSRATKGKYVQMPWAMKELKLFFSESIKTRSGAAVSSHSIKEILKEIISKENKKTPLNDDVITNKINKMGYLIARRTIAKYRESLNIPTARLRKQLK